MHLSSQMASVKYCAFPRRRVLTRFFCKHLDDCRNCSSNSHCLGYRIRCDGSSWDLDLLSRHHLRCKSWNNTHYFLGTLQHRLQYKAEVRWYRRWRHKSPSSIRHCQNTNHYLHDSRNKRCRCKYWYSSLRRDYTRHVLAYRMARNTSSGKPV